MGHGGTKRDGGLGRTDVSTSRFGHGRMGGRPSGHSCSRRVAVSGPGALLEETVTVTGIITAIIVGAIVGALGRLVVPGRQPIPIWLRSEERRVGKEWRCGCAADDLSR